MAPETTRFAGPPVAGGWYLNEDDNLRIRTLGSLVGVVVTVVVRIARPDGSVSLDTFDHVPNSDRTLKTTVARGTCGVLLSATAFASTGSPKRGQVFCQVQIIRGLSGGVQPTGTILQGYITDTGDLAYPGSVIQSSIEGPGLILGTQGVNPAAGAEVLDSLAVNARWRLMGVLLTLVTDATVANREVVLALDHNAGTDTIKVPSGLNQTASQTRVYSFYIGAARAALASSNIVSVPLPEIVLSGSSQIATVTVNLQAGDDYGSPLYHYEEWIEEA